MLINHNLDHSLSYLYLFNIIYLIYLIVFKESLKIK